MASGMTLPRYRPYTAYHQAGNALVHDSFDAAVKEARRHGLDPSLWLCAGLDQDLTGHVFHVIVLAETCTPTDDQVRALRTRSTPDGVLIDQRRRTISDTFPGDFGPVRTNLS